MIAGSARLGFHLIILFWRLPAVAGLGSTWRIGVPLLLGPPVALSGLGVAWWRRVRNRSGRSHPGRGPRPDRNPLEAATRPGRMAGRRALDPAAPLAFDIGMYDGRDTAYYLWMGYRVVGVEANPELIDRSRRRFAKEIESGWLSVENVAIAEAPGRLPLFLCREDLGSSSLNRNWMEGRGAITEIVVEAVPLPTLFDRYGVPRYMKVDIEGADRQCILPLTADRRPPFLSFELGPDGEELIRHLGDIGYRCFKIISQNTFREMENRDPVSGRVSRRMRRALHLPPQRRFLRGGRLFRRSFSSGPMPEFSDGRWRGLAETLERWRSEVGVRRSDSWWDLHAAITEPSPPKRRLRPPSGGRRGASG